jgi:hypothetical protein
VISKILIIFIIAFLTMGATCTHKHRNHDKGHSKKQGAQKGGHMDSD